MGVTYYCDLCKSNVSRAVLVERTLCTTEVDMHLDLCPSCDKNYRIVVSRFILDGGKIG